MDNIRESHPSVETKDAMNLRMKEIFDEIVSKHKNTNDTVVVFSHHAFLHVAIKYFHQEYFATRLVPGRIENASITHYHIT
ncbi:histidine phosphatase family protein [bacterium]|nr:histidine phosphatase family protein [bacterium]